jgi:hypothetical protein
MKAKSGTCQFRWNSQSRRHEHIPWQEQLGLIEIEATGDEYGWDEWLEAFEEGGGGITIARRVATPMPNFRRPDDGVLKRAAATNWDSEFAAAQSHAQAVLAKLGNL